MTGDRCPRPDRQSQGPTCPECGWGVANCACRPPRSWADRRRASYAARLAALEKRIAQQEADRDAGLAALQRQYEAQDDREADNGTT